MGDPTPKKGPQRQRDDLSPHNPGSLGTEVLLMSCGTSLGLTFLIYNVRRLDQRMLRQPPSCTRVSQVPERERNAQLHLHVFLRPVLFSPLTLTLIGLNR